MAIRLDLASGSPKLTSSTVHPTTWAFTAFTDVDVKRLGTVGGNVFRTENGSTERIEVRWTSAGDLSLQKRDSLSASGTLTLFTDASLAINGRMRVALVSDGTNAWVIYQRSNRDIVKSSNLALGTMSAGSATIAYGGIFAAGTFDGMGTYYGSLLYDSALTDQQVYSVLQNWSPEAPAIRDTLIGQFLFPSAPGNAGNNVIGTALTVTGTPDAAVDDYSASWRPNIGVAQIAGTMVVAPPSAGAVIRPPARAPVRHEDLPPVATAPPVAAYSELMPPVRSVRACAPPQDNYLPPVATAAPLVAYPELTAPARSIRARAPMQDSFLPPAVVAGAVAPPPDAPVSAWRRLLGRLLPQDDLPPQNQIYVVNDTSSFDPTGATTIAMNFTTTAPSTWVHIVVVGTHPTFIPWITVTAGATCFLLNCADDASISHDFMWQAWSGIFGPGTRTVTVSFFDPSDHSIPATVTNRGVLVREITNTQSILRFAPIAVSNEQNAPGTGTDAITAGTIATAASPVLVSAVSFATTTAAGPPSAGTGFTANAAIFPKGGVNQALPEQQRVTAFQVVSGSFTHSLGAVNNYVSVAMMFYERGATLGLTSIADDYRPARWRRVLASLMPQEPALPALAPPAPLQSNVDDVTAVRRTVARVGQRDESLPPRTGVATGTGLPEAPMVARRWQRRLRQPETQILPIPTPVVFGGILDIPVVRWFKRRVVTPLVEIWWPQIVPPSSVPLTPPFVAVFDDYSTSVDVDSVTLTASIDDVTLTVDE